MKDTIKQGKYLIIIAIAFNLIESWYFGWNKTAQSDAERVCDSIGNFILMVGIFCYIMPIFTYLENKVTNYFKPMRYFAFYYTYTTNSVIVDGFRFSEEEKFPNILEIQNQIAIGIKNKKDIDLNVNSIKITSIFEFKNEEDYKNFTKNTQE